jgi:hypothetical protein
MNGMLQPWRQSAVSAKLSSHVTSRAVAPLFEIERNGLLDMLLSEPRLLAAAFAVPNRPVAQRTHALAALSPGKRLIFVGRRLIVAEKNLIPVG